MFVVYAFRNRKDRKSVFLYSSDENQAEHSYFISSPFLLLILLIPLKNTASVRQYLNQWFELFLFLATHFFQNVLSL